MTICADPMKPDLPPGSAPAKGLADKSPMHVFANPKRFLSLAQWLTPLLLVSGVVLQAERWHGGCSWSRPTD